MHFPVPLRTTFLVLLCWVLLLLPYASVADRLLRRTHKKSTKPNQLRPFSHITKRFLKQNEIVSLIEESRSLGSLSLQMKAKHLAGALSKNFLANRLNYEGEGYSDDEGEADMSPDCLKMLKDLSKECKWFGGG